MTLKEFKFWFDGFSEGIVSKPTDEQWKKIKDKIGEIEEFSYTPIVPTYPNYPFEYPLITYSFAHA